MLFTESSANETTAGKAVHPVHPGRNDRVATRNQLPLHHQTTQDNDDYDDEEEGISKAIHLSGT